MSDPVAFLLVNEPHGSRRISLDQGSAWTIGRTSQHSVVLPGDLVSRNHALIQCAHPGEYYLIDMGSQNGSYVNGARVSVPRALCDGDIIAIGESTLIFRSAAAAGIAAPESVKQDFNQTRVSFAARLLTVLVVDIRDFTGLGQQVEQKLLCEAIGTWFRLGGKIVQEHGSWTQKYIGDAIMSVWLHSSDREEPDVLPIIEAYLELAGVTAGIGKQFDLPQPLSIGAGINTGIALVGNTGSATISDFTALGDSVNIAFRMESATKQIGADLAVGQRTYDGLKILVRPEPHFKRHVVKLKGYDQPATVWAAGIEAVRSFAAAAKRKSKSSVSEP